MLFGLCLVVLLATVPLAGGRLSRLAEHRFEHAWTLMAALCIQVVILSGINASSQILGAAHVASYGFGLAFVVLNRKLSGLWVVALGAAFNLAAIAANHGVMPATRSALAAAGALADGSGFANSAAVAHPKLLLLGDVFAVPEPWFFANVFSPGDILIVVGAGLLLHQICGNRAVPPAAAPTTRDRAERRASAESPVHL